MGAERRSASPCASAAPTTSWPTRATACAARGCPPAPATTTGSCSTARRFPDPASRWQPAGLRGPSRVVDPGAFPWTDRRFRAAPLRDAVLYELHVGAFTTEGTFEAAAARLPALAELGVTHVELMPVGEFPGHHGWGYDGVYLSAAHSAYGGPQGLARLVDAAHAAGLGVVLDVVYNHVGASGVKALEAFGPYFTERHETPWGKAVNYDGEGSDGVREWVLQSATGWVRDFHVDGLRLDAIHAIHDDGARHVLARAGRSACHAHDRRALVIAESGLNDPKVIRPPRLGGYGHDAVWADDFHHALHALLTGERSGWYEEFGRVAQLAKAFHRPHVHDGGYSTFRGRRFGARADDRPPERFVVFCQNHDQVGNRAFGDRLPARARPLAAFCTLLAPFTPMLFMGEEHGERAPFQFFSDHIDKRMADATREGRREEFAAFAEFAGEEVPDPQDPAHLRALQADPPRQHEAARALRGPPARAARAAARRRQHRVLRGRRLATGAARRVRAGAATSRRARGRCRSPGASGAATHSASLGRGGVRLPGPSGNADRAMSDERGRPARPGPGVPFPLGATWDGEGTNFALFSEHGDAVELCLFDEPGGEERIDLASAPTTSGTATCRASAPASATATASTAPTRPSGASASTRSSCSSTPTPRRSTARCDWARGPCYGYGRRHPRRRPRPDDERLRAGDPEAVVIDRSLRLGAATSRRACPWNETVIYEAHVKGLTMRHPEVPEALRGTYAGLAVRAALGLPQARSASRPSS